MPTPFGRPQGLAFDAHGVAARGRGAGRRRAASTGSPTWSGRRSWSCRGRPSSASRSARAGELVVTSNDTAYRFA